MDYSKVYNYVLGLHSYFPYWLGRGKSLLPLRVQLELTYKCNLKCSMCYQDKDIISPSAELKTDDWSRLIRELPKTCLITLIGGEPLVRKDFKEIASLASKSHVCNLVTNGVLLSKDINAFLVQRRFVLIGVSLDGLGSIHDQTRGVKGTYVKVLANLENLQEEKRKKRSKYPLLDIKTVVTNVNQDNLFELFRKAEELRADFFTISLPKVGIYQFNPKLQNQLNSASSFDFSIFNEIDFFKLKLELNKIFQKPSKLKVRFYPEFSSVEEINKSLYNPKLINENFFLCRQPWSGVQITANGDVYPCLSLNMGNIREKPLKEIWNSEKFMLFRKELKKNMLFKDCLGCCYLKQK